MARKGPFTSLLLPVCLGAAVAAAQTAGPRDSEGTVSAVSRPQGSQASPLDERDPEELWDEHFRARRESPRGVREAVRVLVAAAARDRSAQGRRQKFQHVAALVRAALRHGQGQPWMYDALALALQGAGASREELARSLASAAQFQPDNLEVLLRVASTLAKYGEYRSAMHLLQQAAEVDPKRREPYVLGLDLAAEQGDAEGLRWSACAILEQFREDAKLCAQVRRVAALNIARLDEKGSHEEAAMLAEAVAAADTCDLMVRMSWTGEADLDLTIEEPGSTVCGPHNPQTAAGGLHLGDAFGTQKSETYLCPRAFSGPYRIRVRRVWGQPTAKRVKVEVGRHLGTTAEERSVQNLVLGEGGAKLTVELANGRRTEYAEVPAAPDQRADPARQRREMLARLRAGARRSWLDGPSIFSGEVGPFVTGVRPVVGAGAVAFQPVPVFLPSGAGFSVSGVVSADRRYVRLGVQPTFIQLLKVTEFPIQLGAVSGGGTLGGLGGFGF